ncbi:hypothetical protein ACQ4M3_39790 [Leptolyngbya sp. AN03gr2]|uniref:hypothetical protein n=1 Tax=unclassified Leptolyngbya TaxID=2650499 RepID=UPI003D31ED1B
MATKRAHTVLHSNNAFGTSVNPQFFQKAMNSASSPRIRQPLLAIGRFGLHLLDTPSGRFTFVGTIPVALPQFLGTEVG